MRFFILTIALISIPFCSARAEISISDALKAQSEIGIETTNAGNKAIHAAAQQTTDNIVKLSCSQSSTEDFIEAGNIFSEVDASYGTPLAELVDITNEGVATFSDVATNAINDLFPIGLDSCDALQVVEEFQKTGVLGDFTPKSFDLSDLASLQGGDLSSIIGLGIDANALLETSGLGCLGGDFTAFEDATKERIGGDVVSFAADVSAGNCDVVFKTPFPQEQFDYTDEDIPPPPLEGGACNTGCSYDAAAGVCVPSV